jgi:hypothetical protein
MADSGIDRRWHKEHDDMNGTNAKSVREEQATSALSGLAIVAISDGDRSYGLYRVKQVDDRTMVLGHGAISFPVGMHLDVEDFKYLIPNPNSFRQRATVVENGNHGIRLVW